MTHVLVLLLALLIGVVAGLRSLTAPAVVSWAAFLGWINLHGTWASWMGNFVTVVIVSVLAVAELVNDKRPKTPPRTVTPVFAVRIIWARSPARSSAPRGATGGRAWRWGYRRRARHHGRLSGTYEAGGCPWRPRPADRAARGFGRGVGRVCHRRRRGGPMTPHFDAIVYAAGSVGHPG